MSQPVGIALDVAGGKMYWTDFETAKIQRANLDGSNVQDLVTRGLSQPDGIALDVAGGKMYWTEQGTDKIRRANLDGSGMEDLVTTGLSHPFGIALSIPSQPIPSIVREDVNGDGVVNVIDLALVALQFGQTGALGADVNGDGVVDIDDLIQVASFIGNTGQAPQAQSLALTTITHNDVQSWIAQAEALNRTDAMTQRGIHFLEQLLSALTPQTTTLLANYPNPFNPETWIPYHLAHDADVTLTIYDIKGAVVRQLDLGHQPAGYYTNRAKAAYWDGCNTLGEPVASGVYLYSLTTEDYSATRKMLVLK